MNQLKIPFKASPPLPGLASALSEYISSAFKDTHPDAFKDDIDKLVWLRKEVCHPEGRLDVHISTLRALTAYHAQLVFLSTKFPLDIGLSFSWSPTFPLSPMALSIAALSLSDDTVSLPNIEFERCCILFNIGAMYAQLAASEDRKEGEGIKRACSHFQNAAGVFSHLASTAVPLTRVGDVPPSPDLSTSFLECLQQLMLAQAQECFWQKAVLDRFKNGTIAKLAARVAELYELALMAAESGTPPASTFLPSIWITHIRVKMYHFGAAAQFRKSCDDLGANRYGDELGRLKVAEGLVKKALDNTKRGVGEAVVSDLQSLQAIIKANITRGERDNDMIYLQSITSAGSLSAVVPASMVKPLLPGEIMSPIPNLQEGPNGLGRPLFANLVPYAVHLAISIYDDRKDGLIRDEIAGRTEELSGLAASTLHSLNLPGSLQALEQPMGLPPSLLRKAEDVRLAGGVSRLRSLLDDVRRLARSDRAILDEALDMLDDEATEDEQAAADVELSGGTWDRPPSHVANSDYTGHAQQYRETLEAASKSDQVVRIKFDEWEEQISMLGAEQSDLEDYVPSMNRAYSTRQNPDSPPASQQTTLVRALRSHLETLDDLSSARSLLVEEARRISQKDDVRPAVLREAATIARDASPGGEGQVKIEAKNFELLFEREMGKYDALVEEIEESAKNQEELLEEIRRTNEEWVHARKTDTTFKRREQALQNLDLAYHKYHEISGNASEGLQFYNDFSKLLNQFREDVKRFVLTRRMDINHLIATMNAASLSPPSPPSPPPLAAISAPSQPLPAPALAPATPRTTRSSTRAQSQQQQLTTPSTPVVQESAQAQPPMTPGLWDPSQGIRFG
uniref:BRO1 domain-containing protein n=1 Tax=Bartheletia paradoxa TaxID=669517 RepID=A0A2D0XI44_9BASI|nr:hypothetical protein SPAR05794 [Bartheletia paradoxa]